MAKKETKEKDAAPDKVARAELKRNLANIKKFLKQRDCDAIDMGTELVRSLDEPRVFEELLKGCAIDTFMLLKGFVVSTKPTQKI